MQPSASLSNELKTGVARARGGMRITKRKSPAMYWFKSSPRNHAERGVSGRTHR
jgi:hypothetical protein